MVKYYVKSSLGGKGITEDLVRSSQGYIRHINSVGNKILRNWSGGFNELRCRKAAQLSEKTFVKRYGDYSKYGLTLEQARELLRITVIRLQTNRGMTNMMDYWSSWSSKLKETAPQKFKKIKKLKDRYEETRETFFLKKAEVQPYNPDWETFTDIESTQSSWIFRRSTFIKWGHDGVHTGKHSADFLYRHIWMRVNRRVVKSGYSSATHYEISHITLPTKGFDKSLSYRITAGSSVKLSPFSKEGFHKGCEKLYQKVRYKRLQEEKDLNKLLNVIKKDYQLPSTLFKFLRDQAYLATFCLRYDGKFYNNPKPLEVFTPYGAQEHLLSKGYTTKALEVFIPVYSQVITNCSLTPVKIDLKSLREAVEDKYTNI